jgi:hypothetical protein
MTSSGPVSGSCTAASSIGSQSSSSLTVKMITFCSVPASRSFTHGPTYPSRLPSGSRERASSILLEGSHDGLLSRAIPRCAACPRVMNQYSKTICLQCNRVRPNSALASGAEFHCLDHSSNFPGALAHRYYDGRRSLAGLLLIGVEFALDLGDTATRASKARCWAVSLASMAPLSRSRRSACLTGAAPRSGRGRSKNSGVPSVCRATHVERKHWQEFLAPARAQPCRQAG